MATEEAPTAVAAAFQRPPSGTRDVGLVALVGWHLAALFGAVSDKPQALTTTINRVILLVVFFVISIYKNAVYMYRKMRLKLFNLTYYPNKAPQIIRDDVNKMSKLPRRVACVLSFKDEDDENGGIDGLVGDISELVAWCVSAGIQELSVYEYNGIANAYYLELNRYINKNLRNYFGTEYVPNISVRIPHSNKTLINNKDKPVDLTLCLLSRVDGKPTIVELARTMSELANNQELKVNDITTDLIDEELVELVGPEPDLLILFSPNLDLQDYPPWHIRLSEIYWEPENKEVCYFVFIRALQNYARSKVNVGK